MSLGALRSQVSGMLGDLDGARSAVSANDAGSLRTRYGRFAGGYAGVAREIAELYPVRCARLLADRVDGDAAILLSPAVDVSTASAPVVALRSGISSISNELDTRIQQASPDALVGASAQTSDAPVVSGTPAWDTERTSALAMRACGACHSNQPGWAWYANIAPLSWLVQHDVDAGREVLNFSEWDRPQRAASQVVASVEAARMPPAYAALLNSDLRLTEAERLELASGLHASLGGALVARSPTPATGGSGVLMATLGTALVALGFALGRARRPRSLNRRTG